MVEIPWNSTWYRIRAQGILDFLFQPLIWDSRKTVLAPYIGIVGHSPYFIPHGRMTIQLAIFPKALYPKYNSTSLVRICIGTYPDSRLLETDKMVVNHALLLLVCNLASSKQFYTVTSCLSSYSQHLYNSQLQGICHCFYTITW